MGLLQLDFFSHASIKPITCDQSLKSLNDPDEQTILQTPWRNFCFRRRKISQVHQVC